jgi:hypothetical protein
MPLSPPLSKRREFSPAAPHTIIFTILAAAAVGVLTPLVPTVVMGVVGVGAGVAGVGDMGDSSGAKGEGFVRISRDVLVVSKIVNKAVSY